MFLLQLERTGTLRLFIIFCNLDPTHDLSISILWFITSLPSRVECDVRNSLHDIDVIDTFETASVTSKNVAWRSYTGAICCVLIHRFHVSFVVTRVLSWRVIHQSATGVSTSTSLEASSIGFDECNNLFEWLILKTPPGVRSPRFVSERWALLDSIPFSR